jgi:hypothetical protein
VSSRSRCIVFDVDGIPVRARVSGKLTYRDMQALREIARAGFRRMYQRTCDGSIHSVINSGVPAWLRLSMRRSLTMKPRNWFDLSEATKPTPGAT